jgi:hypothetical protein
MRLFLCILLGLQITLATGQKKPFEKPDYAKIEKSIAVENAQFYYPELLKKYVAGDSSLTLEEKRHLYYGYIFQPGYSPYDQSNFADSVRARLRKKPLSKTNLADVVIFCDSALKENPFDLVSLNYLLYCTEELGDDAAFQGGLNRMKCIVDAIMSSGDGKTKSNAFFVINTADEYSLLDILGFEYGGKQNLIDHYDYLTLEKNDQNLKGLYFDITPCLNHLNQMFEK